MDTNLESMIKVILLIFVVLGVLAVLLARRPWIASRVRFDDRVFVGTFVIAALCGVIGTAAMFIWPEAMSRLHLWELLLIPVFLAYAYWLTVARARGADPIDEKQDLDMGRAGGWAFGGSTIGMLVLWKLLEGDLIPVSSLFPLYMFIGQSTFSLGALFHARR